MNTSDWLHSFETAKLQKSIDAAVAYLMGSPEVVKVISPKGMIFAYKSEENPNLWIVSSMEPHNEAACGFDADGSDPKRYGLSGTISRGNKDTWRTNEKIHTKYMVDFLLNSSQTPPELRAAIHNVTEGLNQILKLH